jgi:hypothetical protein
MPHQKSKRRPPSDYEQWLPKQYRGVIWNDPCFTAKLGWNAAVKKILGRMKYRNKMFEGSWQHEDIDFFMEELKEMIEK